MELCLRKVVLEDILDYFEFSSIQRPKSRSLRNFKSYLVRSNVEAVEGLYRKLSSNYKYPIWINAQSLTLSERRPTMGDSTAYYLYVKDGGKVVDFLGVCFFTPARDLVLSVRYKKLFKWLPFTSTSDLLKIR